MDKISLAGDLGSGKSTVSDILIERLGAEYYSTGTIVRNIAAKYGMSVADLNVYMQDHPEIDHEIDDGLVRLGDDERMLIIDSRMAWHFTKGTFAVYLTVDPFVAGARIMAANRKNEHCESVEATVRETAKRRASEKLRYMTQYGVDITDLTNYSLIVDTTGLTPVEVAEAIIEGFRKWQADKSYKCALISPKRLMFPDDAADMQLALALSDRLDSGEEIEKVVFSEREGRFYVVGGVESAQAYVISNADLIPAKMVKAEIDTASFVPLATSL